MHLRADVAHRVARAGQLDLDHLGPETGEHQATDIAGIILFEREHPDSLEGQHQPTFPSRAASRVAWRGERGGKRGLTLASAKSLAVT